jgi:hypothetical protein
MGWDKRLWVEGGEGGERGGWKSGCPDKAANIHKQ